MNYWAKLILVVVVVVVISEVSPEAVNWLLLLIAIGMVLAQATKYSDLLQTALSVGRGKEE